MARIATICSAVAVLAGCGVSEMYPPVFTGGGSGGGIGVSGGQTGSSGTAGNTNNGTVAGLNTGINGTNGTPAGTSNGVGVGSVGGNTGTVAGIGSSTGRQTTAGTNEGTGIGPGGNATSGFTNGGNTSGGNTTGGGGCTALYAACDPSVGCGCGNSCVFDPVLDEDVCEHTCSDSNPCTAPDTLCNGTICALIPCGPGTGNGDDDGSCSADGNKGDQDGTCFPFTGDGGTAGCALAGTSDGGCDPDATRNDPADLCVVGSYCFPAHDRPVNECYVLCDPGFGKGGNKLCTNAGYNFCFPLSFSPPLGFCF